MELREYAGLDAVGLRELIRAGEVTVAEVEAVARRALALGDAELNALTLPLFEPALDHEPRGPLAGVPFVIKDSGPFARGVPFTLGSRGIQGAVALVDHDLMTRFREAGLVTLGQTTAPELGLSFATESARYGPTRNPWAPELGAGGSSGGAAALVAAGAVPLAHGNDGAGSLRVPAACCGLVGLKPSRGRTPSGPYAGEAGFGMIVEFGLARTVRDAAHLLDAVAAPAVGDKYTAPPPSRPYAEELRTDPGRLRIALTTSAWSGVAVDPRVATVTETAGTVLEWLGHTVVDASPDVDPDALVEAMMLEVFATGAAMLLAPRRPDRSQLEAVSRRVLAETEAATALDVMAAVDAQHRVTRPIGRFFSRHDLLVTPTLGQLPAPHGTLDYDNPDHTARSWLRRASSTARSRHRSMSPVTRRSACRWDRAGRACRSAYSSSPATAARTCCCGWPPSWSRRRRGATGNHRYRDRMPKAQVLEVAGREVTVTNPDKLVFAAGGHTKLDLVRYYLAVAGGALRGVAGRPMILKRFVKGIDQEAFFQKRAPTSRPDWVEVVEIRYPSGRSADEVVVRDAAALAWVVNLGCVDLNPHPVQASDLEHPDELRIDLDPVPGVDWRQIVEVALVVREVLGDHGLTGWPKTSGSRGFHVYARIPPRWLFREVRLAAQAVAREVENRVPDLATSRWWKEERQGVFVDFNQNARDHTVASAYSVRPTPDARVSAPLTWEEVPECRPEQFTLAAVQDRYAERGDPWQGIEDSPGSLAPLLDLAERLGPAEKPPAKGTGRRQPTRPLIEIARAKTKQEALAGLARWQARHPDTVRYLQAADTLVDGMRGRSSLWYRIRVNLQHVPAAERPPQEPLEVDYDPWADTG